MPPIGPATRTRIVRGDKRADYDTKSIETVLDSSFLCHVGFTIDGEARVLPTDYVRIGDAIYLHGHLKNQMLNALLDGQIVCVCVTLLDSLVLARSGFHHSVNYRSVTLFGTAEQITGDEKVEKLDLLVNNMVPSRAGHLRVHTPKELNATLVIKIPIDEAAAKIRTGPPIDAEKDYETDIWAGVIPIDTVMGNIERCPRLDDSIATPEHVLQFLEKGKLFG